MVINHLAADKAPSEYKALSKASWFRVIISLPLENLTSCSPIISLFLIELKLIFPPYGKKINFNSLRKGEIIGEHEVKFSSGKEIITLNHEAFDRALYSEGALSAAKWLMTKRPGLYSMRDLMNFR